MIDKIFAAIAVILLTIVIGTIGYLEFDTSKVTVMIQLQPSADPFITLRKMVPQDSSVTDIKEINRSRHEYEMTVKTHQKRATVIEWMRHQDNVQKVEFR